MLWLLPVQSLVRPVIGWPEAWAFNGSIIIADQFSNPISSIRLLSASIKHCFSYLLYSACASSTSVKLLTLEWKLLTILLSSSTYSIYLLIFISVSLTCSLQLLHNICGASSSEQTPVRPLPCRCMLMVSY